MNVNSKRAVCAGYDGPRGCASDSSCPTGLSAFQVGRSLVVVANNPDEIRAVLGKGIKLKRLRDVPPNAKTLDSINLFK